MIDTREDGTPIPVCYKEASEHLVWEVKKHLTRKACCIKDGHKSDDPKGSNLAGVVSRKNIRIIFDFAALNVLDVYDRSLEFISGRWLLSKEHPMVVTLFVSIIEYTSIVARSSLVSSHTKQIQM